jgi:hypothetical protein
MYCRESVSISSLSIESVSISSMPIENIGGIRMLQARDNATFSSPHTAKGARKTSLGEARAHSGTRHVKHAASAVSAKPSQLKPIGVRGIWGRETWLWPV